MNQLQKLPKAKHGMRRTWAPNTLTWRYIPIMFPEEWNRKLEWLVWNEETDTWEKISKVNGKVIICDENNYIEENLRLRALHLHN